MEKKQCGACSGDVNDLEPIKCGFCETYYHVKVQCCGFNSRNCRDAFVHGAVIFVCPTCKVELAGRSVRAFIADLNQSQPRQAENTDSLASQLQQLSGMMEALSKKVDDISTAPVKNIAPAGPIVFGTPNESKTPHWPRLSVKRRRDDFVRTSRPAADRGTKSMSFEGLSVPSITPAAPPPTFWLYLSGFQPQITDDDVNLIVSRCLESTGTMRITRLVPKGKDDSNMTFVSFKIGLDPALKTQALNAENWPAGLMFREFVDRPKNFAHRVFSAREKTPAVPQDSPAAAMQA